MTLIKGFFVCIAEICCRQNPTPMKKTILTFCIALLCLSMNAQSKDHKLGFTGASGFQYYKGDLGNSFKLLNQSYYGTFTADLGYYLNRSFDAGIFGSLGDYGYCQPPKISSEVIAVEDRCPGCKDRLGLGNLNSRLLSGGVHLKYKFNNGYILKENAKLQPFLSAGLAVNRVSDIMKMNCVNPGNYRSWNAGIGFKYYIIDRLNFGYAATLGYFTTDRVDFMLHGGSNDMYLQSTVTIGIDLF